MFRDPVIFDIPAELHDFAIALDYAKKRLPAHVRARVTGLVNDIHETADMIKNEADDGE